MLYNQDPQPTWARMVLDLKLKFGEYDAPGESTLRDWEKRGVIEKDDLDAPWVFGVGDPNDDALIVPVVRWLILNSTQVMEGILPDMPRQEWPTGNTGPLVTKRMARSVVRVRKAAPDLDPFIDLHMAEAWFLASMACREGSGQRRAGMLIALAPWRDGGALLHRAIDAKVVPADMLDELRRDARWSVVASALGLEKGSDDER